MRFIKYVVLIATILLALALGSENQQLVDINLLVVKVQLPLAVLLFVCFILGMATVSILHALRKLIPNKNA